MGGKWTIEWVALNAMVSSAINVAENFLGVGFSTLVLKFVGKNVETYFL